NGFLGHIRDRFVVIGAFAMVPLLRMPRGTAGYLGTAALVVVAGMTAETFDWHCGKFESEDLGDFEEALAHIPPEKRVAGMVFESRSRYIAQNPFLHFAAYYQVEREGPTSFTFVGYPHWVYFYRPHTDPLGASPSVFLWEWQPDRLEAREELAAA